MKLEDPELADLVDAYRETQRPNEGRRRQMRARLRRATVRRPAWHVYGMTALVAAAALLVIWLGARLFDGTPQQRADAATPAQAPHDSHPQLDDRHADAREPQPTIVPTAAPEVEPGPALPPPKKMEPRPSAPKPTSAPPVPTDTDAPPEEDGLDELRLIAQANRALQADQPERTLRLLQLHERRYPDARTSEERLALRILALCALGRLEEGRGLRHSFLRQFSRSAYRSRIEGACPRP